MALLQNTSTQCRLHLRALHLFGRNRAKVDTVLDGADASQVHASIRWSGQDWWLCDHSRNGTRVNHHLVGPGAGHALAPGDAIHFASGAGQAWRVLDLDPPGPVLLPADPTQAVIALDRLRFLPDEQMPEAVVYADEQGRWTYEDVDGSHCLREGETLRVEHRTWQYFSGLSLETTAPVDAAPGAATGAIEFNFAVSQNEEHVELSLLTSRGRVDLGERSHHYGLLTLARQRLLDARRGFDAYSQGWLGTEQLADMLRVDPKHLNMQLHRARQQISDALAPGPAPTNFIERRRGEVRFGNVLFQIRRGAELEAVFDPAGDARR
ncbi:MAG: FHA domain-containing protein [Duganella sp.]